MRHIAIVGSGPAGFYAAEAALKALGPDARVDILDRLPTPYGLVRAGVAPDHQSIKEVVRRYEAVALDPRVRFVGLVDVGVDVTVDELLSCFDDVILATGAPRDRRLGIPGEDLPGVVGSAAFVGWYNGHPDFRDLAPPLDHPTVVVIGNGNVAIDCARILARTPDELASSDIAQHALEALRKAQVRTIRLVGRRGPHQVSFTLKELGELGELDRATPWVEAADFPPPEADLALEPGQRRVVEVLRRFAATGPDGRRPIVVRFDFFRRPARILGRERVEAIEVVPTRLDETGRAVDAGPAEVIPCELVISAIGYRTAPIPGVAFDEREGRFANEDGRIGPRLWCVGWARRGPSGTIGTNRTDAFAVVERLATTPSAGRPGRVAFDRLLVARGIATSDFADWRRIDALEVARARPGAPREKVVDLGELRRVALGAPVA